jgi:serine/threonine-protein kinase
MSVDASRWRRVKELFHEAQQVPDNLRHAWAIEACGGDKASLDELLALLAPPDATSDILDVGLPQALDRMAQTTAAADRNGERIGAWRLLRLLGEGGMGRVYLAERAQGDFAQHVALKVVRADLINASVRERFVHERSVLARLQHPNIAQLHDGGVTDDGTPYFTLEFVQGEPITRFCDRHALGLRARLELVKQVCAAVVYAHRNLIVHRDLKPSNIFVSDDGVVKLLDFGIAKALTPDIAAADTATNSRVMTPQYAAPEQVLGEPVTTATDVYAIGVLIYELVSGRLPYARADAGTTTWSKAVVEELPEPVWRAPSRGIVTHDTRTGEALAHARGVSLPALRRALRGDLDRILQRALAKSPEARHASVAALAADISAFCAGTAISGGTRSYRARKFISRHWLPLAAGAILLILILCGSIAMVVAASRIEREAHRTAVVKDFLFGLFSAIDPVESKTRDVTARELLQRGEQEIQRSPPSDPIIKAELQAVLGRIDDHLGLYANASELQREAVETYASGGGNTLAMAEAELERAQTLIDMEDAKTAEAIVASAGAHLAALRQSPIADRATLALEKSEIALLKRDLDQGKRDATEAVSLARQLATDDEILSMALRVAGNIDWAQHSNDEAEAEYREAKQLTERKHGAGTSKEAAARANLAMVMASRSKYPEALAEVERASDIYTRLTGPDSLPTLHVKINQGAYLFHLGRYRDAQALLADVAAKQRAQSGADSTVVAGTLINLGLANTEVPDLDAAEQAFTEAAITFEKKYGREHAGAKSARSDLAYLHMLKGDLDRADREFSELDTPGNEPRSDDEPPGLYWWGETSRRRGDVATALTLERRALAAAQKKYGEKTRYSAFAHYYLALALRDSDDVAGAIAELRASLSAFDGYVPGADLPQAATVRLTLAELLDRQPPSRNEAIELARQATDIRQRFLGDADLRTSQAQIALANYSTRHADAR